MYHYVCTVFCMYDRRNAEMIEFSCLRLKNEEKTSTKRMRIILDLFRSQKSTEVSLKRDFWAPLFQWFLQYVITVVYLVPISTFFKHCCFKFKDRDCSRSKFLSWSTYTVEIWYPSFATFISQHTSTVQQVQHTVHTVHRCVEYAMQ